MKKSFVLINLLIFLCPLCIWGQNKAIQWSSEPISVSIRERSSRKYLAPRNGDRSVIEANSDEPVEFRITLVEEGYTINHKQVTIQDNRGRDVYFSGVQGGYKGYIRTSNDAQLTEGPNSFTMQLVIKDANSGAGTYKLYARAAKKKSTVAGMVRDKEGNIRVQDLDTDEKSGFFTIVPYIEKPREERKLPSYYDQPGNKKPQASTSTAPKPKPTPKSTPRKSYLLTVDTGKDTWAGTDAGNIVINVQLKRGSRHFTRSFTLGRQVPGGTERITFTEATDGVVNVTVTNKRNGISYDWQRSALTIKDKSTGKNLHMELATRWFK